MLGKDSENRLTAETKPREHEYLSPEVQRLWRFRCEADRFLQARVALLAEGGLERDHLGKLYRRSVIVRDSFRLPVVEDLRTSTKELPTW